MKTAFQKGVIREDGTTASELMGAYVLPIYFDLVPREHQQTFADHLVKLIRDNDNCLTPVFWRRPSFWTPSVKSDAGITGLRASVAGQMPLLALRGKSRRHHHLESWHGYDEKGAPGRLSFNHYAFGCVDDWIFRNVAGIDTDTPGYTHLIFAPKPDES